jgi:WD40 repeat protein
LKHGNPLAPSREEIREDWDTGVRFCSWGSSKNTLVTASSDGVIKTWDIFRGNPHTSDLLTLKSGVTSADFSPDFTTLVVGEINRTVTVLEIGNRGQLLDDVPRFDFIRADAHRPSCSLDITSAVDSKRLWGVQEITDSGRHQERIPASLTAMLNDFDNEDIISSIDSVKRLTNQGHKNLPNLARNVCAHCNRRARLPSNVVHESGYTIKVDVEQEKFPLCELCGFSCLRCGERIKLSHLSQLNKIQCKNCKIEWDVGTLGYRRKGSKAARRGKEIRTTKDSKGDAEHLHSLWDTDFFRK